MRKQIKDGWQEISELSELSHLDLVSVENSSGIVRYGFFVTIAKTPFFKGSYTSSNICFLSRNEQGNQWQISRDKVKGDYCIENTINRTVINYPQLIENYINRSDNSYNSLMRRCADAEVINNCAKEVTENLSDILVSKSDIELTKKIGGQINQIGMPDYLLKQSKIHMSSLVSILVHEVSLALVETLSSNDKNCYNGQNLEEIFTNDLNSFRSNLSCERENTRQNNLTSSRPEQNFLR